LSGAGQLTEVPVCVGVRLDPSLEGIRVARNRSLEWTIEVKDDGQGGTRRDQPECETDTRSVPAQSAEPLENSLTAEGKGEHRNGGPERVSERQEHGVETNAVCGSDDGHCGQDRSRTRHEDEPETQTEQESAAEIATGAMAEPREWTLHEFAKSRKDKSGCDEEEQRDRNVPQEILRKASWSSSHVPISRKIEKLTTRPAMIANGRRRPPLAEPAKMSGSTGRTQGEIDVMMPARNPIPSRRSIAQERPSSSAVSTSWTTFAGVRSTPTCRIETQTPRGSKTRTSAEWMFGLAVLEAAST